MFSEQKTDKDTRTGLYIRPQQVYVAGRAANGLEPVKQIYSELESLGHTITFKWAEIEEVGKPYRDHKDHQGNKILAGGGLLGAQRADVCILVDDENLWGALTEWGAFLSSCLKESDGRLGYIVGANGRQSVFDVLPFVRVVDSFGQLYDELNFIND